MLAKHKNPKNTTERNGRRVINERKTNLPTWKTSAIPIIYKFTHI
jgi:hypothetical protein